MPPRPRLKHHLPRRFLDEFPVVVMSRLRALKIVAPPMTQAVIPFPDGKSKVLGVRHRELMHGGGWSFFVCPSCNHTRKKIFSIDDKPMCSTCAEKLNVHPRSRMGFGTAERIKAREALLDRLIATLGKQRLRLNVRRGLDRRAGLTLKARRMSIALRLSQLSRDFYAPRLGDGRLKSFTPNPETRALIDVDKIRRAKSYEGLERALDEAQDALMEALKSEDIERRTMAANLLLRSRPGRERFDALRELGKALRGEREDAA